jgi:hypothetical protein
VLLLSILEYQRLIGRWGSLSEITLFDEGRQKVVGSQVQEECFLDRQADRQFSVYLQEGNRRRIGKARTTISCGSSVF